MLTIINSSERPMMTSGITSGAPSMPVNSMRPPKRPRLTNASDANVPNTTDPLAEKKASRSDSHNALSSSWSDASARYHFSVAWPHWFITCESLNE